MIRLSLVPEASEEFAASAAYYESQQRGLGQAFVDEIEQTLDRIAEHPEAAGPVIGMVAYRCQCSLIYLFDQKLRCIPSSLLRQAHAQETPTARARRSVPRHSAWQ